MSDDMSAEVPWPSEFEEEVRRELNAMRAHQLRTDRLIMQLQVEHRDDSRKVQDKVDELLRLLKTNGSGHKHG